MSYVTKVVAHAMPCASVENGKKLTKLLDVIRHCTALCSGQLVPVLIWS